VQKIDWRHICVDLLMKCTQDSGTINCPIRLAINSVSWLGKQGKYQIK